MNLFRLDNDPFEAAKLYQDLHVRKIVLEAAQLLANCYTKEQLASAPKTQKGNIRKHSHIHHPISKWVKQTFGNYFWTLAHAIALANEYEYRFNKKHFCDDFINWCMKCEPDLLDSYSNEETEQPQCFKQYPELVVPGDPVAGYRNYYRIAKSSFTIHGEIVYATWTKREVPTWFY
jgi:hypothetical protein